MTDAITLHWFLKLKIVVRSRQISARIAPPRHDAKGRGRWQPGKTLPPVFSAWIAIRSRDPACERWCSFANFCRDVGPRPSWPSATIRLASLGRAIPDGKLRRAIDGGETLRRVLGIDPDQRCHPTAAKNWFMASRRISNIEVAGIATIVLSVAAVLAVILLSVW